MIFSSNGKFLNGLDDMGTEVLDHMSSDGLFVFAALILTLLTFVLYHPTKNENLELSIAHSEKTESGSCMFQPCCETCCMICLCTVPWN